MNLSKKLLEQIDAFGYENNTDAENETEDEDTPEVSEGCEQARRRKIVENAGSIGKQLTVLNQRLGRMKLFRSKRG